MKIRTISLALGFYFLINGLAFGISETRCISNGVPEGHVVTQLTKSAACPGGLNSQLPNAVVVDTPSPPMKVCGGYITDYSRDENGNIIKTSITSEAVPIPEGYVVTGVFDSLSQNQICDPGLVPSMKNTLVIDRPQPGMDVCGTYEAVEVRREVPVPSGYVVTYARADGFRCEKDPTGPNSDGYFALRLELAAPGISACASYPLAAGWIQEIAIPQGLVVMGVRETFAGGCGKYHDGFDPNGSIDFHVVELSDPFDGIQVCDLYPVRVNEFKKAAIPNTFEVADRFQGTQCSGAVGLDNNTLLLASLLSPPPPPPPSQSDLAWLVPVINLILL